MTHYHQFLESKTIVDVPCGFEARDINPKLFNFQRDIVKWGLQRGRFAGWEDCGLGKSAQQLEWSHQVFKHTGKNILLLAPLAVSEQHADEARKFGIEQVKVCADQSEVEPGITITNYEKLHKFDASEFGGVALDESSILKSFDGKFRNRIIDSFRDTPFKSAWTATPAPNDFMELGNHAEFLGVMTRAEMLATFFVHDGGDTSKWRLKGHAEKDFWRWLCSWAINIRKPSDLGYSDDGFVLPPLKVIEEIVSSNHVSEGFLFPLPASSLGDRRSARRSSLSNRVNRSVEIANSSKEQFLVWCDLNDESKALSEAIDGAVEVTGSDSDEHKVETAKRFVRGDIRAVVTKGSIWGWGLNLQNSRNQIHCGVTDSAEEWYQKVRRQLRFGQKEEVRCWVVTSESEGAVVSNIKRKLADMDKMATETVKFMAQISSAQIHKKTSRQTTEYKPAVPMDLPAFI